ncbi:transcriptional regulator, partial [Lactobacillus reuteri]|nr:transcriptional regulator [Limosilactobacillus reuteri]NMV55437.1 transcriptional regulator [Limosilactobacillus reuteri]
MFNGLSDKNALSYMKNGDQEIDEEDAELLRASLENAIRTSKILAKKKFTPKKYRKNDN